MKLRLAIFYHFFINQTTVFKNACTHKLRPFTNFCKIAVVAFPKSEDLEFRMGMEVPADATNNMIANHVLSKSKDMPVPDELFDQGVAETFGGS